MAKKNKVWSLCGFCQGSGSVVNGEEQATVECPHCNGVCVKVIGVIAEDAESAREAFEE